MTKPSRDQKRKAKLKKRAERSPKHESLAYAGRKYKTDELAPVFYRTELAIYESYVLCEYVLTDDDVEAAVERLVLEMRKGPLPPIEIPNQLDYTPGQEGDLVIASIRRNWLLLETEWGKVSRDDLIGVLRTILHSIDLWRSESLQTQGYLHFIEGFIKKMGVKIQRVPNPSSALSESEAPPDTDTDRGESLS